MGIFYDHILIDFWPGLHAFLERHETLRVVAKVLAYVALLFVVALVYASYQTLDNAGWITHDHDTPVWIQGDWFVGEYRNCQMLTTTRPDGGTVPAEALAELPRLFCGNEAIGAFNSFLDSVERSKAVEGYAGDDYTLASHLMIQSTYQGKGWVTLGKYFHTFPVRYFGRITRPDTWTDSWRCQRNTESLTCKALD